MKRIALALVLPALTALAMVSTSRLIAPAHAATGAAITQSQPTSPGSAPIPVIHANTRGVIVDVVVTKGQDEAVTALHKQDFELFEDGKPQSIDFFEEHTTASAPADIPLVPMPPNVYTNVPAAPAGDSVNVLLLDTLNTPRPDQSYVHEQILNYLRQAKPDARIAIFVLGSRLSLIQGFTDDPALLRAALNDKQTGFHPNTTGVSRTHQDDQEDQAVIAARQQNLGGGGRTSVAIATLAESQAAFGQYQADQRTAMTLDALQSLGRYLAGIPGRKNLIWFAGQYPVYFFPHTGEKQPLNDFREHTEEIKHTSDVLTLSKVAVYPMDATGMMVNYKEDAGHPDKPTMFDYTQMAGERSDKMSTMEQIASDTGGQAFFNVNDLNSAINRVIHNGAHYYTLVYTPANKKMDGQFRHIQVKLTPGKYKLAYRRGYYADDTGSQPAMGSYLASRPLSPNIGAESGPAPRPDPLTPLMDRGMPSASQILYGIRVLPAATQPDSNSARAGRNTKLTGPTTRYTADFLIDWKKIQLQPMPDGKHNSAIRVELIAYDHDGKALNWTVQNLGLSLDPADYAAIQKSGIRVHLELDLPQTNVYLSTGVYDFAANRAGTLEIPITGHPEQAAAQTPATP